MVKADIPEHSRDSSPDKVSNIFHSDHDLMCVMQVSLVSSVSGMQSRTSSSASSLTLDTTRDSSPDFR